MYSGTACSTGEELITHEWLLSTGLIFENGGYYIEKFVPVPMLMPCDSGFMVSVFGLWHRITKRKQLLALQDCVSEYLIGDEVNV